jgi:hypothetical protein
LSETPTTPFFAEKGNMNRYCFYFLPILSHCGLRYCG